MGKLVRGLLGERRQHRGGGVGVDFILFFIFCSDLCVQAFVPGPRGKVEVKLEQVAQRARPARPGAARQPPGPEGAPAGQGLGGGGAGGARRSGGLPANPAKLHQQRELPAQGDCFQARGGGEVRRVKPRDPGWGAGERRKGQEGRRKGRQSSGLGRGEQGPGAGHPRERTQGRQGEQWKVKEQREEGVKQGQGCPGRSRETPTASFSGISGRV